MIVLSIRTDKPEAEVGLFDGQKKLVYEKWQAHRELSVTIHQKIEELLKSQHKTLQDLGGVVCFEGPGSFTGLRIGLTVANTLAAELQIPICGGSGRKWLKQALADLLSGKNQKIVLPEYGGEAHITIQKR